MVSGFYIVGGITIANLFHFVASKMSTWQPTKRRGPIAAEYSSPGPATYGLPGLIGQPGHDTRSVHLRGPAYPFGLKRAKFADECSPGPKYKPDIKIFRDGKDGTPHYSLSSRHKNLKG